MNYNKSVVPEDSKKDLHFSNLSEAEKEFVEKIDEEYY